MPTAVALLAVTLACQTAQSSVPRAIESIPPDQFTAFPTIPVAMALRTPVPVATPRPTPKPTPRPVLHSHSIRGLASWYCKEGVSACHYAYPPGSMVAAACYRLRVALGDHWRGTYVTVLASSGKHVMVQLVDWCGSTSKLIDLYWEPMQRLGGTGVLSVKVSW